MLDHILEAPSIDGNDSHHPIRKHTTIGSNNTRQTINYLLTLVYESQTYQ